MVGLKTLGTSVHRCITTHTVQMEIYQPVLHCTQSLYYKLPISVIFVLSASN